MGGREVDNVPVPVFGSESRARGVCPQAAASNVKPSRLLLFSLSWLLRKLQIIGPAQMHSSLSSASRKVTFKETAKISALLLHNHYVCAYISMA